MLKKGVLVSCTAVHVIRMVPPLTITKEECDTIVDVFEQAINDFTKKS
jgi:acetylornithine/succinyldiaminopimelate/putrescine aminotransferase